jgi:hypothetical protein
VTPLRLVDGSWPAEELQVLRGLRDCLQQRVQAGDLRARPTLQVVVAYITELEGPAVAGLDV